tara:strand:+ start:1277 stop:1738 length:462 start_codon:yes stop_codon:yes gene_type:complete
MNNKVVILIGSETDRVTMEAANPYYEYFNIDFEIKVMSAHRNPKEVHDFSSEAASNGYKIIIAAAGMAAHLAGAVKSVSSLPVIGVPLDGGVLTGLDSLLSTVQMPKGVPVATMSVGKHGAINAAILSAEILALNDKEINKKLLDFKASGAKL